jgi:hypothetical protein
MKKFEENHTLKRFYSDVICKADEFKGPGTSKIRGGFFISLKLEPNSLKLR